MEACAVACSRGVSLERRDGSDIPRSRPFVSDGFLVDSGWGSLQRFPQGGPPEVARSRRRRSYHTSDSEARKELLDILSCKDRDSPTSEDVLGISPPCRTGNPLVKDGNFLRQCAYQFAPVQTNKKPTHCRVAASSQPLVRVEGFSPANSSFVSTARP